MFAASFSTLAARTFLSAIALLLAAAGVQAQFSAPIVLPGDTAQAPPAGEQTNVVFARGAGMSLMVWEDQRADLTLTQSSQGTAVKITDIYAARMDDAGNVLDTPPIVVTHDTFAQAKPKVAWNGQNWLVVWTSRTAGPFFSTQGVHGARISAAGQVLDDPPISIDDTSGFDEREPVVASNGVGWAVVWFANIAFGTDGVRGCLVDPAGTPDAPRTFFQTSPTSGNYYVPTNFELAWAGGRYLLVSEHFSPGPAFDGNILGQFFDPSLTKIGPEFAIATNAGWDQNRAAIASNGAGFFVVWFDEQLPGQVRGSPVSATGVVAVPDGTIYESGLGFEVHAAAGWDGVNWIAAWEKMGPAMYGSSTRVARVSPTGAMLFGSPFSASAGTWTMYYPAVATLNGGALVAWSDERNVHFSYSNAPLGIDSTDLYGAVIDVSGGVATDLPLLLSAPAQTRPDIAGNAASGYLVTFLSETAAAASVMAQRVDALGMPIDPQPVVVATSTRLMRNPTVAFDGTLWLVTWQELGNVFARRVGSNGIPIDLVPIQVMAGTTPDVAAVGGVFLVVSTTNPGHYQSIHAARVRGSDGLVLDAAPIFIGTSYSKDPAVTAFSDRWLVAWQQHPSHDDPNSSIRAKLVLPTGATLGELVVSLGGQAPSVTSDGSIGLVSWQSGSDIHARRIQSSGTMLDTSTGISVSNASNKQFGSESGWDGVNWFVAWNDYRAHSNVLDGGIGDVYGARVDTNGIVADTAGLVLANDLRVPEATPAVAGDLGVAVIAYAMLRTEAPFGTFRIVVENLGGSNPGTGFCFGDGSGSACPCGNESAAGSEEGCLSSLGTGGKLVAIGAPSLAADTLVLRGSQMPNGSVLYFQGLTQQSGGAGASFGDGLRCASGSVSRLGTYDNALGASQYPAAGDPPISVRGSVTAPGVRTYQGWYRNAVGFCTPSTFNLTNGWEVIWTP